MRASMRSKHQSLILKCYPTLPKATEAKPNPSELSYLLYYASTRRSKLQKVGKFLEKRAESDVWRARIGNVYVTLEICRSLIEKCPRDLNLFATSVLAVLQTVLKSKDISLIEQSLGCFESFCAHHDGANLSSDSELARQFDETIRLYAGCATSPEPRQKLRWRSVGLQAIKSIASSDALSSAADGRRQLNVIFPVILQNIYSDSEDHLLILQQRANTAQSEEVDGAHRLSFQTVRTDGTAAAAAAADTAEAADRIEEEDIGLLALQGLKRIFEVNNTSQIRYATAAVLEFVISRGNVSETWATTLLEMVAKWAPVQYRHLILITCQEELVRLPMTEDFVPKQLTVAHLISWLLASNVNLIGLSIMDVLLSFISHIIRLLQAENPSSIIGEQSPAQENGSDHDYSTQVNNLTTNQTTESLQKVRKAAPQPDIRKGLLEKLKLCVGNLATHIYYSDQIVDMISEILVRLRPSASTPPTASVDPSVPGITVSDKTDDFFSFSSARSMGLRCVKEILIVANSRGTAQSSVGRNAVPLSVWDGTAWLLKEEDEAVRKDYVDALVTYLRFEIRRLAVAGNELSPGKATFPLDKGSVSFLKLLHLAIFEATLQYAPNWMDMVAIHLVLTLLVENLGIHALVAGLPMIYKLQSDVDLVQNQMSQVAISSIIAGYLITIGETFGLEDVKEGVGMEIRHRKEHGQWFLGISHPPEDIPAASVVLPDKASHCSSDPILPFENKIPIVNDLCEVVSAETPSETVTKMKDALLTEWSKESIFAEFESHPSRQASFADSRMAGNGTRNYLSVGAGAVSTGRPGSTGGSHQNHYSRPNSKHGAVGNSANLEKFRMRAQTTGGSTPRSASSKSSAVKVDELRKVLTGQSSPIQGQHVFDDSSSGSECQSYISSDGEELGSNRGRITLNTISGTISSGNSNGSSKKRTGSVASRRSTIGSEHNPFVGSRAAEEIPPVPKLPMHIPGSFPSENETSSSLENGKVYVTQTPVCQATEQGKPTLESDNGAEMISKSPPFPSVGQRHNNFHNHHHQAGSTNAKKVDVQSLLNGIDGAIKKRPVSRGLSSGMFRPPY